MKNLYMNDKTHPSTVLCHFQVIWNHIQPSHDNITQLQKLHKHNISNEIGDCFSFGRKFVLCC